MAGNKRLCTSYSFNFEAFTLKDQKFMNSYTLVKKHTNIYYFYECSMKISY